MTKDCLLVQFPPSTPRQFNFSDTQKKVFRNKLMVNAYFFLLISSLKNNWKTEWKYFTLFKSFWTETKFKYLNLREGKLWTTKNAFYIEALGQSDLWLS